MFNRKKFSVTVSDIFKVSKSKNRMGAVFSFTSFLFRSLSRKKKHPPTGRCKNLKSEPENIIPFPMIFHGHNSGCLKLLRCVGILGFDQALALRFLIH